MLGKERRVRAKKRSEKAFQFLVDSSTRLQRVFPMMDNLGYSLFIILASLSLYLAAPTEGPTGGTLPAGTSAPRRTEVDYLQDLKTGIKVLDSIAVSQRTRTFWLD